MPYTHRKEGNKTCVYKKEDGSKVGCTSGSVKKYLAALHMHENEDMLSGGLSDNMTIDDIAKKHNVKPEKINQELKKGIGVELEHTDSEKLAREIAMDHLVEDPHYYIKLLAMEENKLYIGKMFSEELQKVLK